MTPLRTSSSARSRLRAARGSIADDALGLGLRLPHDLEGLPALAARAREARSTVEYFEATSENFFDADALPRQRLDRVRAEYPVVLHGVGLNLLGSDPLDETYLDALARLADAIDAPFFTDHLCWTGSHGVSHHDLLPTPYRPELVLMAAERAAYVQKRVGRPFGLENLSSYVTFRSSTMSEQEMYMGVVRAADCWAMLDINNIYVSSQNHGFDPESYLSEIDFDRVLQVHLAGHTVEPDGTRIDTHDRAVDDAVWRLYRRAWEMGGPFPTLLEWDARIPSLEDRARELEKAKAVRA